MIEPLSLSTAFLLGLLGASHCLVMCGGISAATGMANNGQRRIGYIFLFNGGRIASYTIAGALVSLLGLWLADSHQLAQQVLRLIAGIMLILMGLYVSRIWMLLTRFEAAGKVVWDKIQPLTRALLPVTTPLKALSLGLLWGWLPCGLIYSTLTWVAAYGDVTNGALAMLCFGLGTLPGMLSAGLMAQQLSKLIQNQKFRYIAGALLFLYGGWTIAAATGLLDF